MSSDRNLYGVIGGTVAGNRGAEAMVATTIGQIRSRDPNADFLIFSYMADRDRKLVRQPGVRVVDASPLHTAMHFAFAAVIWLFRVLSVRVPDIALPSSVRALRDCRALFDVSGISFHDGRLGVLVYNVLCVWPALLMGVPVVRLSQAMGPFENPLNRWAARWTTKRCLHTYSRGRHTSRYMDDLGVPASKWSQAADVAFSYDEDFSLSTENSDRVEQSLAELQTAKEDGRDIVAVVPSSLLLKKTEGTAIDYVGRLIDLIHHLQQSGFHVVVLPNATQQGIDTLRNNDIVAISRIRDGMASSAVGLGNLTVIDFDLNTAAIRRVLRETVFVITSRFHAMVAALSLGVPTLVIGWSHKYDEVLADFGCREHALDFTEADKDITDHLDRLLKDCDAQRESIVTALPGVVESSRSQFDILDTL